MGAVVGYAGEHEQGAVARHDRVFVRQYPEPEPAQLLCPCAFAGVVLVVAGHEVHTMPGPEIRQRLHIGAELTDAAVHQIAGDGNHVGLQRIDRVDDRAHIAALDRRADMHIADLHDRETVQRRRQIPDRYIHVHDAGPPPGVHEADDGRKQGQRSDQHRRKPHHSCGMCTGEDRDKQQDHITQ